MNKELHLFWGDQHVPYEDKWATVLVLDFIWRYEPGTIHLLGDLSDCYTVSKHRQDPARKQSLWHELTQTTDLLAKIREVASPRCEVHLSEGNHESRLRRFVWDKVPELSGLVDYPTAVGLADWRIHWHPETRPYKVGPLLVTHGKTVRKHSAYTARCEMERFNCPVIHGHTHRMGAHYRTPVNGHIIAGWENGCTCLIDPDLHPYTDLNWQQGFSVAQFRKGYFQMEQVLIHGRGPDAGYIFHGKWHGIPARYRTNPWPASYMALEKGKS